MNNFLLLLATLGSFVAIAGCSNNAIIWRYPGASIVPDKTADGFELVQRCGPADKTAERLPTLSVFRRIEGETGRILAEQSTWARLDPQPDILFGWHTQFAIFDHDENLLELGRDLLNGGAVKSLHLPGTNNQLLRLYPSPVFAPPSSVSPFDVVAVNCDTMTAESFQIPEACSAIQLCGENVIIRNDSGLSCYALGGKELWHTASLPNERLSVEQEQSFSTEQAQRRSIGSQVATIARVHEHDGMVIVRDLSTGKMLLSHTVQDCEPIAAYSFGGATVLIGTRGSERMVQGQPVNELIWTWSVWGRDGSILANGIQPEWTSSVAFEGGPLARRVTAISNSDGTSAFIGCGKLGHLIVDAERVESLSNIPGQPVIIDGDIIVCRDENGHFAIDRKNSRFHGY